MGAVTIEVVKQAISGEPHCVTVSARGIARVVGDDAVCRGPLTCCAVCVDEAALFVDQHHATPAPRHPILRVPLGELADAHHVSSVWTQRQPRSCWVFRVSNARRKLCAMTHWPWAALPIRHTPCQHHTQRCRIRTHFYYMRQPEAPQRLRNLLHSRRRAALVLRDLAPILQCLVGIDVQRHDDGPLLPLQLLPRFLHLRRPHERGLLDEGLAGPQRARVGHHAGHHGGRGMAARRG